MTLLTLVYIACFQLCALPSLVRIRRRQSSADLSVWREWLLIVGVIVQFVVMLSAGVPWQVWLSPALSFVSVSVLLGHIYWYRERVKGG